MQNNQKTQYENKYSSQLTIETQYVQTQILDFDTIQAMMMNSILIDDKKLIEIVERTKLEEE